MTAIGLQIDDCFRCGTNAREHADWICDRVWRTVLTRPGFAVLEFDRALDSFTLRAEMIDLVGLLVEHHRKSTGSELRLHALGRFDQQNSTRFHLDGAPPISFLILGYEPTTVVSELWFADYSAAAFDRGCSPSEYLDRYNPMNPAFEAMLDPYARRILDGAASAARVVVVNNSDSADASPGGSQLGLLHKGVIPEPDLSKRRVINSALLGVKGPEEPETVSKADVAVFLQTDGLAGY